MKNRIQGIIIGSLIAVLLFGGVTALATETTWKNIDVAYAGYNVFIDGISFVARDGYGLIEPFSYNGWIYAPFEHIAVALGKSAWWDPNTRSLYLGRTTPKGTPAPFLREAPVYDSTGNVSTPNSVEMGGNTYTDVIRFNSGSASYHNLDGKFEKLTGYIGRIDGTSMTDSTIAFFDDNDKELASYQIKAQDLPQQITVNVKGVKRLYIKATGVCAFANIKID